jgi:hypothetical protein
MSAAPTAAPAVPLQDPTMAEAFVVPFQEQQPIPPANQDGAALDLFDFEFVPQNDPSTPV